MSKGIRTACIECARHYPTKKQAQECAGFCIRSERVRMGHILAVRREGDVVLQERNGMRFMWQATPEDMRSFGNGMLRLADKAERLMADPRHAGADGGDN